MQTLAEQLAQKRREIYLDTLVRCRGNRARAARELGVTERAVFRFCADELTDHDRDVIAAKCAKLGGIDPKSLAGAGRV